MPAIRPRIPVFLALLTLSACATACHFVDQPPLTIDHFGTILAALYDSDSSFMRQPQARATFNHYQHH